MIFTLVVCHYMAGILSIRRNTQDNQSINRAFGCVTIITCFNDLGNMSQPDTRPPLFCIPYTVSRKIILFFFINYLETQCLIYKFIPLVDL